MLRRQSPNFDKSSFLSGTGEMAGRLRDFDWASHPLGPPDGWPSALRSALGIALNSAFPTCIYWGAELRLLYNDSWSVIPGPRHPDCLGKPAAEVWPDIWHIIEPQLEQVIETGEGVFVEDQMLPMRRFGVDEETYWTYNFTPIRLDDGSIGGIFNSGNETTRHVLQQRSTQMLLELSDLFRAATNAEQVRHKALEMLGRTLGADRVGLRAWCDTGAARKFAIIDQWIAEGVRPISPTDAIPGGSDAFWNDVLDGHVIRLDGSDPARDAKASGVLAALGVAAALAVPWVEDGQTRYVLFVHSRRARHWTDLEIDTVEAVLARLMNLLDRTRAAERERLMNREINHRARNLLTVVLGLVRLAPIESPEQMRAKLLDRIAALARNITLLSDQNWQPLKIRALLEQQLGPYFDTVDTDGPDIQMDASSAQALGMALHEMTTNAAKYGALRDAGGKVSISWSLSPDNRLTFDWIEHCPGGIADAGSGRTGFGSKLLQLMIESQLGGALTRDLTPTGLHCRIVIPWNDGREPQPEAEPA